MSLDPSALPPSVLEFVTERHLAMLATLRPDGSPHLVPVGFTWDDDAGLVRVITSGTSVKARNAGRGGRAAVSQVDGRRWLTLEGTVSVLKEPDAVADAVRRYAGRYRQPRQNPLRVVVQITVDRVLGSAWARPADAVDLPPPAQPATAAVSTARRPADRSY